MLCAHVLIIILGYFATLGGSQGSSRTKRTKPTSSSEAGNDVDSELEERNNQLKANYVPPGFISPSVIEYLELGKSIPVSDRQNHESLLKPHQKSRTLLRRSINHKVFMEADQLVRRAMKKILNLLIGITDEALYNQGRPGSDYPVLGTVPYTNFYCDDQAYPGFYADEGARCQSWHYCDIDGRQTSFLCPNGTQFSQAVFVCDWWFNVRCDLSSKLYVINSRLYGRPKLDPTLPHRSITKQLLENIFNDEERK